ncbi:uncharacterized protein LOC123321500 [Coccinella septempunctata]|uniref:uncharacterized protein LOC123321500 n=1 Tax=Coccinella septempunctata TaxID=41139 RepID=UPI001D07D6FE|nr:uncharacterized protein LOC123321500 [Coccinella septempunctata]XP_044765079.1 uncharacterized protein LOC123321500 [Coccinella septempunctata]
MKLLVLIILIAVFHSATPAALVSCPKFCKCEFDEGSVYAKCISQKFLTKIDDKQANTIERLDLSNTSITSLDKRLKKLKNLKYLDVSNNELQNLQHLTNLQNLLTLTVSNNKLETVPVSVLPKNIRDLDISYNSISDLPKDISSLHNLKTLHLQGNPVNCDETAINRYVNLVTLKVNITEHVECYSPKDVNGKRLQTLIADSLLNPMLGDQEETSEMEEDPDNSEFIKHSTEKPEKLEKPPQEDDLFEGSGEEGSGNYEKEEPSACIIDCSTFKPLEIMKENNTSPLLSIKEQVGILFEDLFGKEQDPTTVAPTSTKETPVEEVATKKIVHEVSATKTTMKQTEKLIVAAKESKTSEDPNKAAFDEGLTYYLIGTVIVLMVVVAIFIIVKKRVSQGKSRRRRNSMTENGICEEMKPLGKYREISNGTNNEQQKEDNVRPERIPLINGQNGKTDLPKDSMEELDITMRSADNEDGASPKPERVTIKSSEIPPSVLKTPQLVHREINSDGEIVTKPLDDSY